MRFESGLTDDLNSTEGEGEKVHRSIACLVGEEESIEFRVCIASVKTVDGEFPAYREPPKINKLHVINFP